MKTAPEIEPATPTPPPQPAAPPQPFDMCGELPTGTTVLEASAGTGKTYAIAALAARYIAEGVAELGQLMLVTFGRMATNELRLRVRERLVSLEARLARMLEQPVGSRIQPLGPPIEELLCAGSTDDLRARHERVAAALAEFDAATIATTHEFCLHMLDGLGVLGDREPNAVFVEQLTELTREVASDVYLSRYAASGVPPLSFDDALKLAEQAVGSVHATLVPQGLDAAEYPDAAERHAFATLVRAEVLRRKLAGRLFTYDDMLTRLRDALADPQHGPAAANRLRARYRIVMVDEFQDTDPIQWEILRRAFHGHTTLILIGDPKQAIYAFRGADVYSYLDAVRQADHLRTLATNWRSDAGLVSSLHALMGGAALGDPRIVVRPVGADHLESRLLTATDGESRPAAALRLRVIEHARDAEIVPRVGELRPRITADLVADVVELLSSGSRLALADPTRLQPTTERDRPVGPSDVAVLVRTNDRGEGIRDALIAAGVPAVMLGASSVYASTMAEDWLTLLTALEQPRQSLVRRAALTCFFGWSFEQLATADERALVELSQRVRSWTRVLGTRGVAALVEAVTTETGLPERLLRRVGGERQLTDLRHIGQNLHAAMVAGQLGISALVEWLRERMAEARGSGLSDRTRRLETDAEAVTVLTVHASKGLEFPVVYLPDAWDQHVETRDDGRTLSLHATDADGNSVCQLDVGGRLAPDRADRFTRDRAEDSGEQLRLLYVAMTRAKCQVVTWWAPSRNTPASALQRFLYRPAAEGVEPLPAYPLDGDPRALPVLQQGFSVETVTPRAAVRWQIAAGSPALPRPRNFDRDLDLAWRRTSYSSLTAAAHGIELSAPGVGSEAEPVKEDDETLVASVEATNPQPAVSQPDQVSPMQDLPSGVEFGTLVHTILEAVDPAAADLPAALRAAAAAALTRTPAGELTPEVLAAGLLPAMETPLGPLAGGLRLRDVGIEDRLAELVFELPLAGGDATTAAITLGMLAPLLRRHLGPDDRLHGYADLLEHPILAEETLRGYLNGSIDAVLRVRDGSGVPRYLVVDYKTNWLGGIENGPLLLADYEPRQLAEAMLAANYPLQALLYLVAVHRLLRWRQPNYDPATHLGGVLYLFVRGMAGADTPQVNGVPHGVFSWQPPPALVTELSDLLHGRLP